MVIKIAVGKIAMPYFGQRSYSSVKMPGARTIQKIGVIIRSRVAAICREITAVFYQASYWVALIEARQAKAETHTPHSERNQYMVEASSRVKILPHIIA